MYEKHFGFREDPFGPTPDPRFLYCSREHAEALAALHYGLVERRGLQVLVAAPGMGKTTLLHHLLERWKHRAQTALVWRPPETREQMIGMVLEELGIEPQGDYGANVRRLAQRALECRGADRRMLLFFDEAQRIPPEVLEEIRLLLNLESPEEKLIEIVLAGQPELARLLAGPLLGALGQRAVITARIRALDREEVRRYVEHRLRVAGVRRRRLLSQLAYHALARASQGTPRRINTLCFEAFSAAFAEARRKVFARHMWWAAAPEAAPLRASLPWSLRRAAGVGFVLLALAMAATGAWPRRGPAAARAASASPPVAAVEAAPEAHARPPDPPAAAPEAPAKRPLPLPVAPQVVVLPKDTLRQIALRRYGRWDGGIWRLIRRANPALTDPGRLPAGQVLALPEVENP